MPANEGTGTENTDLVLVAKEQNAIVLEAAVSWNYTSVLNVIFLLLTAALLVRFFRTGGKQILAMMHE